GAQKVLIVCDDGVMHANWGEKVVKNCQDANLACTVFSDITSNPKDKEVHRGVKVYLDNECDAVVGVGGGSALDAAKAIAIIATNGGNIHDYEGVDKIDLPLPPLVMVSTTAGSGSEVSQFSIIVDTGLKKKLTIVSKSLIPDIAIVDPITLSTKDAALTASTGLDVLTHAIEAYVSVAATPLTDVQAKNAISLVSEYLRPSVASTSNKEAKNAMAMASLQAGLAFSNAILGAVHAMYHAVGGRFSLEQGEINAVLLPYVMEYNLLAAPKQFAVMAEMMGENINGLTAMEAGKKAISYVRKLAQDIGTPTTLSAMGLDESAIPVMSQIAIKDACMITNPRDVTIRDVEELFRLAL